MSLTGGRPRRLLSVAHSYCVALNRRLAHEMKRAAGDRWEVTAVAPSFFRGELRPVPLELIANEPCRLEVVPAYFTKQIHVMLYGRRLRQILREPWDLVHCWEEPYILAAGQIARWMPADTPMVFWTAQNLSKRYPPPFNWIERLCLERCRGWMACGESIVQSMLPRGFGCKPYRVMPLGVDLDVFRPDPAARREVRKQLGWDDAGPPVVGYLGRFVDEKGISFLTRVLDEVKSPWRALFVGGGPLEGELRRWGRRHGDRVAVLTGVKHAAVPAHLNAMDVLCGPSQTRPRWREQLGRMLIEAFACGVPVVASDSGEIPYVVADAGRVVGEADLKGWASALGELLDNPSARDELRARGLERVRVHYNWPVIGRRHLQFFEELLDSPGQ